MAQPSAIIVGSGIVGSTFAYLLTQKGWNVDVFEKGPEYPYPHLKQYKEQTFYLYDNPEHYLPKDLKNLTQSGQYQHNLEHDYWMGVGGSATRWWAITLRMSPNDFRTKSRYGYGDDWPIGYDDLETYYCRAESLLGVSGTDEDNPFAPPRSQPYPLPPFELGYDDQQLAEKLHNAGIVMHTTPQARTRHTYEGRAGCKNFGVCHVCPIGSRYSPNYHLDLALKTGRCTLHSNVSVRRVVVDQNNQARSIVYQNNDDGREHELAANVIIVAAGAIESARLLLLSTGGKHPNGLGNNSGQVGKNLAFHHAWFGNLEFDHPLYFPRFGGVTGQCQQFVDPPSRGKNGGVKVDLPFNHGPSYFLYSPNKNSHNDQDVLQNMREMQRYCQVRLHAEAIPGPEKSMTLSEQKDRFGDPFAHINYSLNDLDYETYRFSKRLFERIVNAIDPVQAHFSDVEQFSSSAHHHGTCRMGDDARTSVVNSFGAVHGVPNLFLGGGSQFVSTGSVNSTLTMVALAIRTSDYLLDQTV